jgi:hypothetical protein
MRVSWKSDGCAAWPSAQPPLYPPTPSFPLSRLSSTRLFTLTSIEGPSSRVRLCSLTRGTCKSGGEEQGMSASSSCTA